MGTSIERHSCNSNYYTMGNTIPGIKIDGNNVFAVREGMKMIKNTVVPNGPVYEWTHIDIWTVCLIQELVIVLVMK